MCYLSHVPHVSKVIHRVEIRTETASTILSGALRGQQLLARLLPAFASEPPLPQAVFLDFSGVDVATGSFIRESVLALRDTARARRSNIFPVVANANESVREELAEVVRSRGGAIWVCTLDEDEQVSCAQVIGELDPKQKLTFNLVKQRGAVDAAELMRDQDPNDAVTQTAWNNRLASLVGLGLVVEDYSAGRTKRYRLLL